jgi:LacI family transcriptional regulator
MADRMQTLGGKGPPDRPGRRRSVRDAGAGGITLKSIAKAAGVDISTVSRALAGNYGVNDATRKKVLAIAEEVGYRPNLMARSLVTGRSQTIGLLISDIRNPFFAELARGAEDAAHAAGHDLILCNSDIDSRKQWNYVRSLREKCVTGIIMNSVSSLSQAQHDDMAESGIPIVLLNPPPRPIHTCSTVTADNLAGGELAASYLIGLGHRSIAHLTGGRDHGNFSLRLEGFERAARSSAADVKTVILEGDHTYNGGYQLTWKLLSQAPGVTAIFAANDIMAFGVLRALAERGVSVPDDISVLGFDNVELAGVVHPRLTTINQPKWELGRVAVEMLLRQEKQRGEWTPEHIVMGVDLVEGRSCARVQRVPKH